MNRSLAIVAFTALLSLVSTRADVPALAKIKASAEAGNAEAQYTFAKTFGAGGSDWTKWLSTAAAQGYGPAEDELAWVLNWPYFQANQTDPKSRAYQLKSNGAKMRQALIYASSAADKGFGRSRMILAMAYANGYFVQQDLVEAYKWIKLSQNGDITSDVVAASERDRLLKTMPLQQVKDGEARAANYRPGNTAHQIRNAMVVPCLKLAGIVTSDGEKLALVNGSRLKAGHEAQLNVEGLPVKVFCVSIDAKTAVICLPPDSTKITLRPGIAAEIGH